jgi:hypothetical protein
MRVLKVMLAVACVASVISIFRPITPSGGTLGIFLSVINAALFGSAFCGIQKRLPLMWKLGFVGIVVLAANFLLQSLSVARSIPTTATNLEMESGFLAIATVLVTAYWLLWWRRQKGYFINGSG